MKKTFLKTLIALLLILCLFLSMLQTKWAKEKIAAWIVNALEQEGIEANIDRLGGQLPFTWTMKKVELRFSNDVEILLHDVKIRLSFLSLFKKKLSIHYLKIKSADLILNDFYQAMPSLALLKELEHLPLPFHIDVRYLSIPHISIGTTAFGVEGSAKARKGLSQCALDLKFSTAMQRYLRLIASGDEQRNTLSIQLKGRVDVGNDFAFLSPSFQGVFCGDLHIDGAWESCRELIYDLPRRYPALKGTLKTTVSHFKIPDRPLLSRDWKLLSSFSLPSFSSLFINKLYLLTDLCEIDGKGELTQPLEMSKALLHVTVPDLFPFSSLAGITLYGRGECQALYNQKTIKGIFNGKDLWVDEFHPNQCDALLSAEIHNSSIGGILHLATQQGDLDGESSFAFDYLPKQRISIDDFTLKAKEVQASASLTYEIDDHLFEGTLFAQVKDLTPFAALAGDENLAGSFALESRLWHEEKEQHLKCYLLSRHVNSNDILIDNLSMSAQLFDCLNTPRGEVQLTIDQLYSPRISIDGLTFKAISERNRWPFYFNTEGRIESPFECSAQGFITKTPGLFSLDLTDCSGVLNEQLFCLSCPSSLEIEDELCRLSPFNLSMGEGTLHASFTSTPTLTSAEWALSHFPIEPLSCFYPRIKMRGTVTASGEFDATEDNLEGFGNAVLEEAGVYHFGKKEPFQAKGSLQMHANRHMLQVHADVRAIDDQFIDCSASLPIQHTAYPFALGLNPSKPVSMELIAEGNLEDMFDFVNLGTQYATGHLACRLFLSNTLSSPSLQGKLDWEMGSYENYFTGTVLRHVNASLEAENDTVTLLSLEGEDSEGGKMTASGKINLKPSDHFPYSFAAELSDLHMLGFDLVDSNFTGPLYITGNTQSALAQGNLIVPEATFHIANDLPYEPPVLPITYINRPPYLSSQTLLSPAAFPFHMDLELTADKKVFLEWKGLNSEWQGTIHLTGTNTNVAASGSLNLLKGEYIFSGKIFKLTEGEIIFNDKPAPSAYLKLAGSLTLPDATITAMLFGPLTSPKLTFQSNPHMATSSILARILFNKEISDISQPEAIQLASTLMSLSGGAAPDVLEAIRKGIGVDRLTIASASPGSDEVAVQIGKYLTRGVMITLSQSATSSQVIVEVELPNGFIFRAETQEEEEGKFSLKWTRSY
jgi:translocation and assembly module TamB